MIRDLFWRAWRKPVVRGCVTAMGLMLVAGALTWFLEYRYFMLDAGRTWDFFWQRSPVFAYNTLLMWLWLVALTAVVRRPWIACGASWALVIVISYIEMAKFAVRGTPLLPEDFLLASETASMTQFVNGWEVAGTVLAAGLAIGLGIYLNWLWRRRERQMLNATAVDMNNTDAKTSKVDRAIGADDTAIRAGKIDQVATPVKQRGHFWIMRLVILSVSILALVGATDFVRNHSGEKYQWVDFLQSELVAWNQTRNYDYNGFILGFLYNLQKFDLTTPDNYSEETIAQILAKYENEKTADEASGTRQSLATADYNIVMILNESFYDPAVLSGYYNYASHDITAHDNSETDSANSDNVSGDSESANASSDSASGDSGADLLPNLHKIMQNYPHGWMYSLDYGGGTANIEFEADTGLTNYWTNTVPYTDLVPRTARIPSVASWAKENGYATTAIHAYNGGMYKRNIALAKEGFDTFIDESEMQHHDKESDAALYYNDRAVYQETLDVLRESDERQMVSVITMQNHTPYSAEVYGDETEFELTAPTIGEDEGQITESEKQQVETYLQSLHNADKYLGEFLAELEELAEPTVVLFYGDHSAGLFELVNNSEDKTVRDLTRLTPYFVWANFALEAGNAAEVASSGGKTTKDAAEIVDGNGETATSSGALGRNAAAATFGAANLQLSTTTPNCLTNTLYDILQVKKPTLSYLTAAACAEQPILTAAYFNGQEPEMTEVLEDYKLVTYDVLGGGQWVVEK